MIPLSSICSSDGFKAPNRRQAIIQTNVDWVRWCHMASLHLTEFSLKYDKLVLNVPIYVVCHVSHIFVHLQVVSQYQHANFNLLINKPTFEIKQNLMIFSTVNPELNQGHLAQLSAILTHWGRLTHICVNKLTIIGSDNGLSPERRQAIIRTNAGILSIGTLGTNLSEILSEIHTFFSRKSIWKCLRNGSHFDSASMC